MSEPLHPLLKPGEGVTEALMRQADEIERLRAALEEIRKNAESSEWSLPSSFANCARTALSSGERRD